MTEEAKKAPVIYFDNDYIEKAVAEATEFTPAFTYSYKPLNVIQASRLTDEIIAADDYAGVSFANVKLVSEHLVKWDLQKPNNEVIDFSNMDELQKMSPKVIDIILKEIRRDNSSVKADAKLVGKVKDTLKN
jgi:hypothetical protein